MLALIIQLLTSISTLLTVCYNILITLLKFYHLFNKPEPLAVRVCAMQVMPDTLFRHVKLPIIKKFKNYF